MVLTQIQKCKISSTTVNQRLNIADHFVHVYNQGWILSCPYTQEKKDVVGSKRPTGSTS